MECPDTTEVAFTDRYGFEAMKYDMFLCMSVDVTMWIGMVRSMGYVCA